MSNQVITEISRVKRELNIAILPILARNLFRLSNTSTADWCFIQYDPKNRVLLADWLTDNLKVFPYHERVVEWFIFSELDKINEFLIKIAPKCSSLSREYWRRSYKEETFGVEYYVLIEEIGADCKNFFRRNKT
ncbi:MAG: hypothetical protein GWN31_08340 [Candidatus Thorarchaeota archaeon]|nr:hypothetical protein [Candidatus Thorarchaeota archaeon]NIW13926.1 hypothetical protein [Candidatus Thorarchaeota archaeon]NIW52045.1 hypothetical protein [Candidatus Korarchaeota archaeon]